ncbi:expressed unknown protein [Seminavis robusta]|uniref:Uncharacterized protein n=1 Tax=Seminavis robusta TaxID=568900 RepID=A0A9N8EK04_9STRA|nr:expressed unknown protein [Seminavis robusta]|eukprot:Sro1309_g261540.1 n/a (221) ;mRNA; r:25921-26583
MFKSLKKLFRRGEKTAATDNDVITSAGNDKTTSETERTSEHPRSTTHVATQSWKVDIAKAFVEKWNEHDMVSTKEMVTEDFVVVFSSAENLELDYDEYAAETNRIHDACPDFSFCYDSVEEQQSDGVVVLHNLILAARDFRTDNPYAFGPQYGSRVEYSSEKLLFYFKDGKICKQIVAPEGQMPGPAGIYTQIFLCGIAPIDLVAALNSGSQVFTENHIF